MAILNSIRNNFLKTELSRKRISHTVVQTTYPRHIYNLCNYTLFPKQCQQNGLYPPPAVSLFLSNCYVLCFQNHIIHVRFLLLTPLFHFFRCFQPCFIISYRRFLTSIRLPEPALLWTQKQQPPLF